MQFDTCGVGVLAALQVGHFGEGEGTRVKVVAALPFPFACPLFPRCPGSAEREGVR